MGIIPIVRNEGNHAKPQSLTTVSIIHVVPGTSISQGDRGDHYHPIRDLYYMLFQAIKYYCRIPLIVSEGGYGSALFMV